MPSPASRLRRLSTLTSQPASRRRETTSRPSVPVPPVTRMGDVTAPPHLMAPGGRKGQPVSRSHRLRFVRHCYDGRRCRPVTGDGRPAAAPLAWPITTQKSRTRVTWQQAGPWSGGGRPRPRGVPADQGGHARAPCLDPVTRQGIGAEDGNAEAGCVIPGRALSPAERRASHASQPAAAHWLPPAALASRFRRSAGRCPGP